MKDPDEAGAHNAKGHTLPPAVGEAMAQVRARGAGQHPSKGGRGTGWGRGARAKRSSRGGEQSAGVREQAPVAGQGLSSPGGNGPCPGQARSPEEQVGAGEAAQAV